MLFMTEIYCSESLKAKGKFWKYKVLHKISYHLRCTAYFRSFDIIL